MDDNKAGETVVGEITLCIRAPPLGDASEFGEHDSVAVVLLDRSAVESVRRRLCTLAADVTSEYLASLRPGVEPDEKAVRPLAVSVDDAFRDSAAQYIADHRETVAKRLGHELLELTMSVSVGEPGQTDLLPVGSASVLLPPGGIERFIEQLGRECAPAETGADRAGKTARTARGNRIPVDRPSQETGPNAAATASRAKSDTSETASVAENA